MADELVWKDTHRHHGRVIGYDEVRLEQADVPDDVVAAIEAGDPPKPHPNGIDKVIDAAAVYLTAGQAVEAALLLLDAAQRSRWDEDGPPKGPTDDREQRWRLHVHACSVEDMTFWVERDGELYRATEVETGVSGPWRAGAEAALDAYWRMGDRDETSEFERGRASMRDEIEKWLQISGRNLDGELLADALVRRFGSTQEDQSGS